MVFFPAKGHVCDLLREKGPIAVKRCFKTQLTAFSLYTLCHLYFSKLNAVECISFKERKKKKKKRGQPHSPNLKGRNAFNVPHTAENNVQ